MNSPSTAKAGPCKDFLVTYSPKGKQLRSPSMNIDELKAKYHVDHWRQYVCPTYDTMITTNNYHICLDKDTSNFYI